MSSWQTRLDGLVAAVKDRSRRRYREQPADKAVPAYVYLLADNLDAALAAGEDLLQETFVWNAVTVGTAREIALDRSDLRAAVASVRSLEMILVARVLKSRERAEELARRDERFRPVAQLYNGGTAILLDAVADHVNAPASAFDCGTGMTAYLRSRGLIEPEEPAPADGQRVDISEDFKIAERIRLGDLLDLVAMFLDSLETHYNLYEDLNYTLALLRSSPRL